MWIQMALHLVRDEFLSRRIPSTKYKYVRPCLRTYTPTASLSYGLYIDLLIVM